VQNIQQHLADARRVAAAAGVGQAARYQHAAQKQAALTKKSVKKTAKKTVVAKKAPAHKLAQRLPVLEQVIDTHSSIFDATEDGIIGLEDAFEHAGYAEQPKYASAHVEYVYV
jgi:hypothetical protein